MRIVKNINFGWKFVKIGMEPEMVSLPHTWNAVDGQDGGNDYYRGACKYIKKIRKRDLLADTRWLKVIKAASENDEEYEVWLEFAGVAMMADVEINGTKVMHHDGGFSTFRMNITEVLQEQNEIIVTVDNSYTNRVYPQKADFTFYGGLYRDVNVIIVPKAHFALSYFGSHGIKVTPKLQGEIGVVTLETWTENVSDGTEISFVICDEDNTQVAISRAKVQKSYSKSVVQVENPHLWNGIKNPYLYSVQVSMGDGDSVEERIGFRTFKVDSKQGFILNGHSYPLCGAARHQDRQGMGNAITKKEHEEDMDIMLEMGANTIRLAHYQHDQYFYDLCDEKGMIIWAEIPYITQHMPEAKTNSISQMQELVVQNYHHPSIVCWGLSNEITAAGGVSEDMIENHRILNDLCHELDTTRVTTMAHAFMLDSENPFVTLADIRSYNLYYGWYLGTLENNDEWFDDFHEKHPDVVMGLSEYGADANPVFQTAKPERGDWTETYQAIYHEHMLAMWAKRPYIWAMQCWNMFDFGADGRNEGGKPGQNQKGLVTFDRKIRKDAFYIYKAYLSEDPFVHICGRRYVDRVEDITDIKVYTNQKMAALYVDGILAEEKTGAKVFCFRIQISGEHTIEVRSGELSECIKIRKVDKAKTSYRNGTGEAVENWFDKPDELMRKGYYSILDSMSDIKQTEEGTRLIAETIAKARESYGEVAKSSTISESAQRMMDQAPFHSVLKQTGKVFSPAMIKEINHKLNQIPKQ